MNTEETENIRQQLNTLSEQMQQVLRYTQLAAKNVLTMDDVAVLTGLSKSHLYKLTCTHQIPYYRPNGKYLYFDRKEIENWMKQNRQNTQLEAEQMAAAYIATKK